MTIMADHVSPKGWKPRRQEISWRGRARLHQHSWHNGKVTCHNRFLLWEAYVPSSIIKALFAGRGRGRNVPGRRLVLMARVALGLVACLLLHGCLWTYAASSCGIFLSRSAPRSAVGDVIPIASCLAEVLAQLFPKQWPSADHQLLRLWIFLRAQSRSIPQQHKWTTWPATAKRDSRSSVYGVHVPSICPVFFLGCSFGALWAGAGSCTC